MCKLFTCTLNICLMDNGYQWHINENEILNVKSRNDKDPGLKYLVLNPYSQNQIWYLKMKRAYEISDSESEKQI